MMFFNALFVVLSSLCFAQEGQEGIRDEVGRVILKNIKSLKTCYTDSLKYDPNIEGKIVIEWDIWSDGSPRKVTVKSSTLNSKVVEKCIVEKFEGLKFPIPPNGAVARISYPFVFSKNK